MPEPVIDRLEMVDVDHRHHQRPLGPACKFRLQPIEKGAAITQSGQRVGGDRKLELGVGLCCLANSAQCRDGRRERQGDQQEP